MTIRKQITVWGACVALFLAGATAAGAATIQLRAYLNGAQVPLAVGGTGVGTVSFDTVSKLLSWSVTFSGLGSAFTAAHFHGPAAAGTNGAITVPMSGSTSPLTGSATLDATQEAQLLSGQWYINIHTINNPNGEIRGQVVRVRGDLDGDGRADVLWRNETSGFNVLWPMNGLSVGSVGSPSAVSDLNWQVQAIGDFDGDGKTDVLWKNTSTGTVVQWLMNGAGIASAGSPTTVADLNWVVQGVGDFDGDGKADVLWQNRSTGQVVMWLMNGTSIASSGAPNTVSDLDWQVQGVGDFNGDGKADILWQNRSTGQVALWLMNGMSIATAGSPNTISDLNWLVQGVGDFDGDGRADVLWKNISSGTVVVWLMNGMSIASVGVPTTVTDQKWRVHRVADFDGDGRADIFWRHSGTGTAVVWLMNGVLIGSSGSPGTVPDLLWTAQGQYARRWAALIGAQNAANALAQVVNTNGVNLAESHLTPLLATGYMDDGFNAAQGAGLLASDFRGSNFSSLSIDRLFRLDAVNQAAFFTAAVSGTAPGPTPFSATVTEQNGGLGFKRQSDGTWKMYGNQRPGEMGVQTEMRTDSFPGFNAGPQQHVNVDVRTLQNLYTAVTISGGGLFNNTSVPKSNSTDVVTVQADPSPATPLTHLRDTWFTGADSALTGPATFTITVTPASGPLVTRRVLSNAITTQAVTITSPTLHTLAAANLDNPLSVSWTLPAFPISAVNLSGNVSTSVQPNPGFQCGVNAMDLATNATSGQITFPSLCNGLPVLQATINLSVDGVGGERTIHLYGFQ